MAHGAALVSISLVLSHTPAYTARPRRSSVSRGMPVYFPASADTVLIVPTHEGMARLS